jgi:hypothetical protein
MAGGLDLGKQVGPLPLGGWLAVVAGGLGIGIYMNKRQAANDTASTAAPTGSAQLTESDVGEGGTQYVYTPPQPATGISDESQTNDEWGRQVINWLVGTMNVPGTTASNTVARYLDRQVLTATELAQMNLAIGHFGAPPEPLAPVDQPPGDTTTPPASSTLDTRSVSGLHVSAGKGRNSIGWTYKGNADGFAIRAIIIGTTKYTEAYVPAIPGGGLHSYSWTHIASPSAAKAYTYDYRVIPMKGSTGGVGSTKRAVLRP